LDLAEIELWVTMDLNSLQIGGPPRKAMDGDLAETGNCVDLICHFFLDEKVTKKSSRFENRPAAQPGSETLVSALFHTSSPATGLKTFGSRQIDGPAALVSSN
jgi:hypothetical protein